MNILAGLLLLAMEDVTLDKIQALAKVYLRDSAEVPMVVDVNVVVTNPTGAIKSNKHSVASMIFHGYNQGSGKFSLRASKGGLTPLGLGDSMGGDVATFIAGSAIFNKEAEIQIHQAAAPGKPILVTVINPNCPALDLLAKYLLPHHTCGKTEVTLTEGEAGNLVIQHVEFKSTGAPADTRVLHLGTAHLTSFQYRVDFQLKYLAGETKPYLWPLQTVNIAVTDKGTVTITNKYTPKR